MQPEEPCQLNAPTAQHQQQQPAQVHRNMFDQTLHYGITQESDPRLALSFSQDNPPLGRNSHSRISDSFDLGLVRGQGTSNALAFAGGGPQVTHYQNHATVTQGHAYDLNRRNLAQISQGRILELQERQLQIASAFQQRQADMRDVSARTIPNSSLLFIAPPPTHSGFPSSIAPFASSTTGMLPFTGQGLRDSGDRIFASSLGMNQGGTVAPGSQGFVQSQGMGLHNLGAETVYTAQASPYGTVPTARFGIGMNEPIVASSVQNNAPLVPSLPAAMAYPGDEMFLSQHQVFLRTQVEYFQASEDDLSTHVRGRNKTILVGQVGIRCRYCAHIPVALRQKGSTYFPATMLGLYQASQNLSTTHLQCGFCNQMPDSARLRFTELLPSKVTGSAAGRRFWANSAMKFGLVDTDAGIWLMDNLPAGVTLIPDDEKSPAKNNV